MKKNIFFHKTFVAGIALAVFSLTGTQNLQAAPSTVLYGSVIKLKHKATGKYLTSGDEVYSHHMSSRQNAIYCTEGSNDGQLWIIKGAHHGDRWNCNMCSPVCLGETVRFEHVKTGRNLHSHDFHIRKETVYTKKKVFKIFSKYSPETRDIPEGHPSPSGQQEVTAFGNNGTGDGNDNWRIDFIQSGLRGVLGSGSSVRLIHIGTNKSLNSNNINVFQPGKSEVYCFAQRNDNDFFEVEIVNSPAQSEKTKAVWQAQRGGTLNYNTMVVIDPLSLPLDAPFFSQGRRLWTHAGSRHDNDGRAVEPHAHLEILSGPANPAKDVRSLMAPSLFLIENAANLTQAGPVKYGDKVKILSLYAAPGTPHKGGVLSPAKYWWEHQDSRHGKGFYEIIISRDEHADVKTEKSQFILEPVAPGVTGDVYQNDFLQIKCVSTGRIIWLHGDSRFGGNVYGELLTNKDDDKWGKENKDLMNGRECIYNKFKIQHANRPWFNAATQIEMDRINAILQLKLGSAAEQVKAALEASKKAQADASNVEAERLAKGAESEAKRLEEENARKLKEAEEQFGAELKKAKDEADRMREEAKKLEESAKQKTGDEATKLLDEAKKTRELADKLVQEAEQKYSDKIKALRELLDKYKGQADAAIKLAKEKADLDARKREEAAKLKLDPKALEAQRLRDEAELLAKDMELYKDLPAGFTRVNGIASEIALGMCIHTEGKKKTKVFDAWAIGKDNKLLKWIGGINPWMAYKALDDKDKEITDIKDIAIGIDSISYLVTSDGKVYRYNPEGKVTKAPVIGAVRKDDTSVTMKYPTGKMKKAKGEKKSVSKKGVSKKSPKGTEKKSAGKGKKGGMAKLAQIMGQAGGKQLGAEQQVEFMTALKSLYDERPKGDKEAIGELKAFLKQIKGSPLLSGKNKNIVQEYLDEI
jgi:hypothetical protein